MNELLDRFYEQYNYFFKEITTNDNIIIGTLGPSGTSSEQALKYLSCFIKEYDEKVTVQTSLKNNFLDVYDALNRGVINYALIPTAYERVTDFFWNNRFVNNLNFIFPTPDYGLVCRKSYIPAKNRKTRIACCPAVENIIEYLSDGELKNEQVEKVTTNSTTEAIISLINDEVDMAITNKTSFNRYLDKNIKFISKTYNANIVWSLFKQRENV